MLQNACSKAYDGRLNPCLCLGDDEGGVLEGAHDRLRRDSLDGFERPSDSRRNNRQMLRNQYSMQLWN
jgi:hypothetical protein